MLRPIERAPGGCVDLSEMKQEERRKIRTKELHNPWAYSAYQRKAIKLRIREEMYVLIRK
jgi:hypothetical protein